MPTVYENLLRIVDASATRDAKILAMRGFAEELDWTPSYELQASLGVEFAEDHLVVEHGLERSAIITFLKAPARAGGLSASQIRALLSISYNNLVDWHIFVSQTDVRHVYNLAEPSTDPNADRLYPLTVDEVTKRLSATEISRLELRVRRNLPACDEALIGVIKRWKSLLAADYPAAGNTSLSTLFNALIFVRGCEDRLTENGRQPDRPLLTRISQTIGETVNMANLLGASLSATGVQQELGDFLDLQQLEHFAQVDKATAINLCRDFYTPRDASYDFNFAFMSKHALSRIYEQYVALFQNSDLEENKRQLTFVNAPLTEYAPSSDRCGLHPAVHS